MADSNRVLVIKLGAIVLGMFGFGYAMVPLYDVFCEVTGLNGRTSGSAAAISEAPDESRTVKVEFISSLDQHAPWEFRPASSSMIVHPGKAYVTTYVARNLADRDAVGHAVPSVAPGQAAKYFHKTECFCFTEQAFKIGEEKDMPVRFILDPDLPAHIDTVTLSYTFFEKLAASAP